MNERFEGQSYYDILEITPSAGVTDIYKAYQKVKVAYSPSSPALYTMFTPEEAKELMALIEEAYQTLSHQAKRKEYDIRNGFKAATPSAPEAKYESTAVTTEPPRAEGWIGPVKVSRRDDDLPMGFAKTRFSVYEVKAEIEEEIKSINECDGNFLQKVRLYKGVTLDRLCEEMRVSKSTLVALESNDLEALPVAVFTRGFVVQFARLLGLDERRIADAYMKYFKARKT